MMKSLVIYYSLSGTTRTVAAALAEELGADLEEIRCSRYSPGFLGYVRAGYDSWRGKLPPIVPLSHNPSHYDLVIIGGPVWASHLATPVRTFLRDWTSCLSSAAFFLTHGGPAPQQVLREMETLAGVAPIATATVQDADVKNRTYGSAVSAFAATLRNREPSGTHGSHSKVTDLRIA